MPAEAGSTEAGFTVFVQNVNRQSKRCSATLLLVVVKRVKSTHEIESNGSAISFTLL